MFAEGWRDASRQEESGLAFLHDGRATAALFVTEHKRFSFRRPDGFRWLFIVAMTGLFLALIARFHLPGKGFTALIMFGGNHEERFIPELKALDYHVDEQSWGYDAQWYAQLAIEPDLRDPDLMPAIDNLPYRARRILFSWTAWLLGGGQPGAVLEAYALQNVLCWLGLAVLMLRWFKPVDWDNCLRWAAVLFSFGMIVSVRSSLVDGPGLLLVAAGVALFETGRPWWSALVMGISGLGKETNLLGAAALAWPKENTVKAWAAMIARGLLAALPLALWTGCILMWFGAEGANTGSRAFGWPLVEWWRKLVVTVRELMAGPEVPSYALSSLFMIVSVTVQFLVVVLRPRWREAWWRVGAAYAVLLVFLGEAVWEGYPGATSRVMLPLLLAFNVLVPKGRAWWAVLVLGNLTVLNVTTLFKPPGGSGYELTGPSSLVKAEESGALLRVKFDGPWFPAERTVWDYWRWSEGGASVVVTNPHAFPVTADVSFRMSSRSARRVNLAAGGRELWSAEIDQERRDARVKAVVLAPGETVLRFETDRPGDESGNPADKRPVAFRLLDFRIKLTGRGP
jgi:hypothetical protein